MQSRKKLIGFSCKGGEGKEATVMLELRKEFPGLGGVIKTKEGVAVGVRIEHNPEPQKGHRVFLIQLVIKKMDDFFYRCGIYHFSHIPRPLGSVSKQGTESYEASFYQWGFGREGFGWKDYGGLLVVLKDWEKFCELFDKIGINLWESTTTTDDRSKDIIHMHPVPIRKKGEPPVLCSLWKRIDFGPESIRIDWNKLLRFLVDRKRLLVAKLRIERYEMLLLTVKFLTQRKQIKEGEIVRLTDLIGSYRCNSLEHYAKGFGPSAQEPFFGAETEKLL